MDSNTFRDSAVSEKLYDSRKTLYSLINNHKLSNSKSCRISPNSQLYAASDNIVDLVNGSVIGKLFQTDVEFTCFSSDGNLIATALLYPKESVAVQVWSANSYLNIKSFTAKGTHCCNFSPDSKELAIIEFDCSYKILNLDTQQAINSFNEKSGTYYPCTYCDYCPNNKYFAVTFHDKINLLDRREYKFVSYLTATGYPAYVNRFSFSPDSLYLAVANSNSKINIWDLRNLKEIAILSDTQQLWSCNYSPDGNLIAASSANTTKIWNSKFFSVIQELPSDPINYDGITECCFSHDGEYLISSSNDIIKVYHSMEKKSKTIDQSNV